MNAKADNRYDTIVAVAELGCAGANQFNSFTRCGMSPWQERFRGFGAENPLARQRGCSIGRFKSRPSLKLVTLGQLAAANGEES